MPYFPPPSSGSGYSLVEDEGVALTVRSTLNFVGAGVTASDLGGKTVVTIPGSTGASWNSFTVAFTDGDSYKRVTRADAAVTTTSKIALSIRRADTAGDSADKGYIFLANVVSQGAETFDILIHCQAPIGADPTENPPNETITINYTVS